MTKKSKAQLHNTLKAVEEIDLLGQVRAKMNELERTTTSLRSENDALRLTLDVLNRKLDRLEGLTAPTPLKTSDPQPQVSYKIGQRFRRLDDQGRPVGEVYLFASVAPGRCNLFGLASGGRWTDVPMNTGCTSLVPKSAFDAHFVGPFARAWSRVE